MERNIILDPAPGAVESVPEVRRSLGAGPGASRGSEDIDELTLLRWVMESRQECIKILDLEGRLLLDE